MKVYNSLLFNNRIKFTRNFHIHHNSILNDPNTTFSLYKIINKGLKKSSGNYGKSQSNLNLNAKSNNNKTRINNTNVKSAKYSIEELQVFSHSTAQKYYRLNSAALIGYNIILLLCIGNPDYPDYHKKTMMFSSGVITLALFAISVYAKRHVKNIKIMKPANILTIETFGKLGITNKGYNYQIPLRDVKEIVPLSDYIKTRKTGVYLIYPFEKTNYFRFLNFFFIRPEKKNLEFDQLFKSKLRSRF